MLKHPSSRRVSIAAIAASFFLAACQTDQSVLSPVDSDEANGAGVSFAVSDGANGGSDAVWYLPPLVDDPAGEPGFEPENFNPNLDVEFQIFACNGLCPGTPTGTPDVEGDADVAQKDGEPHHYKFKWDTPEDGSGVYRAFTVAEGVAVGFIDIELVKNNPGAGNVAVAPGKQANFKVVIEDVPALPGVGCDVDVTECQGVVPSEPTGPVLLQLEDPDTGDANPDADPDLTLSIPAGTEFMDAGGNPVDNVVFSLETCAPGDDLDADILLVGPCYTVLTFVDGVQTDIDLVGGVATVSICDLDDVGGTLMAPPAFTSQAQEDRVSIIHFDNGEFYEALEHTDPVGCAGGLASAGPPPSGLASLARSLRDGVLGLVAPQKAIASSALIDRGGGGRVSGFRSHFRGALPSKIIVDSTYPTDGNGDPIPQRTLLGTPVLPRPAVQVVDVNGEAVQGAFVNFVVEGTAGNATVDGQPMVRVPTDMNGVADVSWVLETFANPHDLKVFAKGMTAGIGAGVLQPPFTNFDGVADNVLFGGVLRGVDFCAAPNECAANGMIAESIVFQADADDSLVLDYDEHVGYLDLGANPAQIPQNWLDDTFDPTAQAGGAFLPGPFAPGGQGCPVNSSLPPGTTWALNTTILTQKRFNLPEDLSAIQIHVIIDNDARIAINGTEITADAANAPFVTGAGGGVHPRPIPTAGNPTGLTSSGGHSLELANGWLDHDNCTVEDDFVMRIDAYSGLLVEGGENVVTVLSRDRGGQAYYALKITADLEGEEELN